MQKNFNAALAHVLSFAGGWSGRLLNSAAPANHGISVPMLERYRGQPVSDETLQALTKKETAAIYRSTFWDACKCGLLPSGIDLAVFDCAVAEGPERAVRLLQEALNVKTDGLIGAVTLAAVRSARPEAVLAAFIANRMRTRGVWQRLARFFVLGAARRLLATHTAGLALLQPPAKPRTAKPANSKG